MDEMTTAELNQYLENIAKLIESTAKDPEAAAKIVRDSKAYDLKYHYVDYGEVPAGASDYAMMEVVQRAAKKVPWFQTVYFEGNVGGTDDAAVMLTKVQQNGGIGSYVGIGADTTGPVHNPEFDFDEDCLQAAMELCVYALEELHGMDA